MTPLLYPGSPHIHPYPTGEDLVDSSHSPYRVWTPEQSLLVLGYSQEQEKELRMDAVRDTGMPVYRRKGGGGAVLLTPGTVCIALRLKRRREFGIRDYFALANGWVRDTLRGETGLELQPRGISDLAHGERKVLGSSLYLPRDCALYLGSLLVDSPLALLDRFLAHPSREPEYRQGRPHSAFLRNLAEIPGLGFLTPAMAGEMLRERLAREPAEAFAE